MILGKVVGSVWATKKDPKVSGVKFLIVRQIGLDGKFLPAFSVAADSVGAGSGETVLMVSGSSARMTDTTKDRPIDTVIMAIVDKMDVYHKE